MTENRIFHFKVKSPLDTKEFLRLFHKILSVYPGNMIQSENYYTGILRRSFKKNNTFESKLYVTRVDTKEDKRYQFTYSIFVKTKFYDRGSTFSHIIIYDDPFDPTLYNVSPEENTAIKDILSNDFVRYQKKLLEFYYVK